MACPDLHHKGKPKVLACLTCNKCVCETCINTTHVKHELKSFDVVAEDITKKLLDSANSPSYTQLEEDQKDIAELCENQQKLTDKSKRDLYDQRDKLKKLLDDVTNVLVTKLDQAAENLKKDLDVINQKAADQMHVVQEYREGVARLQTSDKPLDVVEQGWLMIPPEMTKLDFPILSRLSFQKNLSANRSTEDAETLLGELIQQDVYGPVRFYPEGTFSSFTSGLSDDCSVLTLDLFGDGPEGDGLTYPQSESPADVSPQLTAVLARRSLQCDVGLVHRHSFKFPTTAIVMRPTPKGSCWIRCFNDTNNIILVNADGEVQCSVPFKTCTRDIFVSPVTHNVLVSCPSEKCIKLIVKLGKPSTKTVKRTDPLMPRFMCGTPSGDFLVTLSNKTSWSVESHTTSVLVKYNSKQEEVARACKDAHGDNLFCISDKVSTSRKGTVAVINSTSNTTAHLVLLDNNLKLTLRYVDHGVTIPADKQLPPVPTLPKAFCISDATFNHQNLMLICEKYSGTVQLMDSECNPLQVLLRDQEHVPWVLALHANGDLWISFVDGTIKVYDYELKFRADDK